MTENSISMVERFTVIEPVSAGLGAHFSDKKNTKDAKRENRGKMIENIFNIFDYFDGSKSLEAKTKCGVHELRERERERERERDT